MGNTCGGAPHSTTRLGPQGETRGFKPWTKKIKVLTFPSPSKNLDAWRPDRADSQRLLAGALRRCRCLWLVLTSWGTLACKVRRCSHAGVPGWTPGGVAWEPAPWRDKLGALRDISSTLSQSVCWGTQHNPRLGPDRLMRRVLSEERGKCCPPRPVCGYSRATPRSATHYLNCRRCQPSQSTGPRQSAFAFGSPVGVGCRGLGGGGGVLLRSPA